MQFRSILPGLVAALAATALAGGAQAEGLTLRQLLLFDKQPSPSDHLRLIASPYTAHVNPSERHRPVWMLGVEKQYADGDLLGAAYFSNSFGQDSLTVYRGEQYRGIGVHDRLYLQWTAGLMYGYKREFQDEVPLNVRGFSPMAVVSVGWQFTPRVAGQVNLLGLAALMFQFSMAIP